MEDPAVPPSEALPFHVALRTRWVDEDNQGVLNNAIYMTLFEEARHAYFERLGLLSGNQFPFLLAQTNVRFIKPGRGGVEVRVAMATIRLGNSSFEQVYRVSRPEAETWCEARALLVCYDPQSLAPRPMTEAFRGAVSAVEPGLSRA